jgi:deoxyribose-phosphate aldolase
MSMTVCQTSPFSQTCSPPAYDLAFEPWERPGDKLAVVVRPCLVPLARGYTHYSAVVVVLCGVPAGLLPAQRRCVR